VLEAKTSKGENKLFQWAKARRKMKKSAAKIVKKIY
jgi:hypothetical protein